MPRPVTNGLTLRGQRIRDVGDPAAATDAATRSYVDAVARGLDWKEEVRVASTGDLDLAAMPAAVDGVNLANGDRFLAKDQADAADRGVYVFNGAGAAATRALDADADAEVNAGLAVTVLEGATKGTGQAVPVGVAVAYLLRTPNPIQVGVTDLAFSQLGGSTSALGAGAGLVINGGNYDVGATDASVLVDADGIRANPAVVVRKHAQNIGDGAATVIDVGHNLGTFDVTYDVYEAAGARASVIPDAERTDVNTLRFTFATAPANGEFRVVVHG